MAEVRVWGASKILTTLLGIGFRKGSRSLTRLAVIKTIKISSVCVGGGGISIPAGGIVINSLPKCFSNINILGQNCPTMRVNIFKNWLNHSKMCIKFQYFMSKSAYSDEQYFQILAQNHEH